MRGEMKISGDKDLSNETSVLADAAPPTRHRLPFLYYKHDSRRVRFIYVTQFMACIYMMNYACLTLKILESSRVPTQDVGEIYAHREVGGIFAGSGKGTSSAYLRWGDSEGNDTEVPRELNRDIPAQKSRL